MFTECGGNISIAARVNRAYQHPAPGTVTFESCESCEFLPFAKPHVSLVIVCSTHTKLEGFQTFLATSTAWLLCFDRTS